MNLNRLGFDQRAGRVPATFGNAGPAAGRKGANSVFVDVIPKTDFGLAGAVGPTEVMPLAVGIDSSDWVSGIIEVRVHTKGTWTGTQTLNVVVDNIALVPEEPQTLFLATSGNVVSTNIAALAAGALQVTAFGSPIGSLLRVSLQLTTTVAPSSVNNIALSINLVGRFA